MFNTTNSSADVRWTEPFTVRVIRLSVFAFIVAASLFGNGLVVKTVIAIPRRRTPFTYTLVFNLAIAELVNTLMLPYLISYDEMESWIFGQFLCQLISPLQNVANSVITCTVAAIAACRCCLLVFQGQTHKFQKHRYAMAVVVVLWFLSFGLALPGFLFNRKVESPVETFWCITLLPGDSHLRFPNGEFQAYILVQITFNFVVNGTIMVLSYGIVIYKLNNSNRIYINNNEPMDNEKNETTVDNIELSQSKTSQLDLKEEEPQQSSIPQKREMEQKKQQNVPIANQENGDASEQSMDNDLFRMFYAIVLIFILCYFPYQIVFIMEYFNVIERKWMYLAVTRKYLLVLTSLPSALHPLCYGLMTKFYSKAFKKIILCK